MLVSYQDASSGWFWFFKFPGLWRNEKPAPLCYVRIDHFVAAVPSLSDARPSQRELETMGGAYDSIPTTNGASPPRQKQSVLLAAVYGLVASLMCAPVMMSFASIIFADPFFSEYAPELVKLVLFSSAVHQLCYVKWSTMPFAVGQVQDAGLIFLSSMARFVVADGQSHDDHAATTMAAALWTLGLATALLGAVSYTHLTLPTKA